MKASEPRGKGFIKAKSFQRASTSPSRAKSISRAYDLLNALSIPNSPTNSNASSLSPSPPRYDNFEKVNNSNGFDNKNKFSFCQKPSNANMDENNIQRNADGRRRSHGMEKSQDDAHGIVETLDVDSDPEIQGDTIVLTNLNVDVTEVEIQKTISTQSPTIKRPSKITIRRFAGKCDASLFFDNDRNATEFRSKLNNGLLRSSLNSESKQNEKKKSNQESDFVESTSVSNYNSYSETSFSGPSSPQEGVSPPRLSESENNIQIVEEIQHVKNLDISQDFELKKPTLRKVIPIFVDIFTENGKTISKIKVNLVTHQKCQQFYGQEPTILVSAFLNYMKKYYQDKRNLDMVFVTPCVATFDLFFAALTENPVNKEVFDFYFSYWADLQSLVTSCQESSGQSKSLTAAAYSHARIAQLWQHVKYPEIVTSTDSVQTMKFIMDEVMARHLPPFHQEQLFKFTSSCNLSHKKYMTVVLHVGILEVDIQYQGRVLPVLGTLGFRNSQKGSWFVPVEPTRKEGSIVVDSTKLGFAQFGSTWVWSQDTTATCLVEREALECFISVLREEKEISESEGVVLVTPRQDVSLPVLISALVRHNLLDSFLSVVDGLADIEQLASTRNIEFQSSGLKAYEKYYLYRFDQCIDLTKSQIVPKIMYQILESILYSMPSNDNFFSQYAHPVISPYTNNLLYQSQLLEMREDYHRVTVLSRVSIKPASLELVSLLLKSAPKTDIGREFYVLGYGNIKFGWNKAKLAPNLHLVLTIQNTGKQMLVLETGDSIGLAHKQDSFPYPESQFRQKIVERSFTASTVYTPSHFSYSQLNEPVRKLPELTKQRESPKVHSTYEENSFQQRISETLPFGDMIRKYRNQLPNREVGSSTEQACIAKPKEPPQKANLDKRSPFRDPRLNRKLAKAQQTINTSCVQNPKLMEKTDIHGNVAETTPKSFSVNQMGTSFLDPRLTQKPTVTQPVININLSKEKICRKTLEQVDKEVKAIAVTINLEQRDKEEKIKTTTEAPSPYKNRESPIESSKQDRTVISAISKSVTSNFIKQESKIPNFKETNYTEKKMQSGTCFDFLKESIPVKKSNKYISKREELIRNHHKHYKIGKKKEPDGLFKSTIKEEQTDNKKQSKLDKEDRSIKAVGKTDIKKDHKKSILGYEDGPTKPKFDNTMKKDRQQSKFDEAEPTKPIIKNTMKKERKQSKLDEEPTLENKLKDKEQSKTKNHNISKHSSRDEKNVFKHIDKTGSQKKSPVTPSRETSPQETKHQMKRSLSTFGNKTIQVERKLGINVKSSKKMENCNKKPNKEVNTCNLCKEVFNVIGTYRKHSKTKHIFKCDFCELIFNRATKLDDHMNTFHDFVGHIEPTQCGLCGDVFRRSSLLARHISSPHTFSCRECEMKFQNEKSLNKHHCHKSINIKRDLKNSKSPLISIETFDSGKEHTAPEKKDSVPRESERTKIHLKRETMANMAFIENATDLIIINPSEHQNAGTNVDEPDQRKEISKLYSSLKKKEKITEVSKDVQLDKEVDDKQVPKEELCIEEYKCTVCIILFEDEKELFQHNTRIHHESWSYVNAKKNATWQENENMDEEPKGPFVCQLCTEVHKLWGPLFKHLWIPHLFKCEYCELSFNRNTKLEDHVNTVHDLVGLIDSTQCGLCGETFGRSSTLARHINSPHNFPCNQCGKCFQSKSMLNKHRLNCSKFLVFNVIEKCLDSISY